MSSQFSRVNSDPNLFIPPPPEPANDPFANVSGKLGDFLRNGGPLDSGIHRQTASRMLLDNTDAQPEGADPFDFDEGLKYMGDNKTKDYGVTDKPKDPRLKKDKDVDKPAGEVEGKGTKEPRTLQELMDEERQQQKKAGAFDNPPSNKQSYYEKNTQHLDLGKITDYVNEKAYQTKLRDKQLEADKEARKNGDKPSKDAKPAGDANPSKDVGFFDDRIDKNLAAKRTAISSEVGFGNFAPTLREGSLSSIQVQRDSAHIGHEQVSRLNGGRGYSQTNGGLWGLTEQTKRGATIGGGLGARAEIVDVIDTGAGDLTLRANGLAGMETSAGGKFKTKPYDTNISGGAEIRAGLFGEAGATYRPVNWEPKIFGAPVNLSPEVEGIGRVFTGGELGAGAKAGWRFLPDPVTGKMSPEIGIEAKGAAFIGGKAEGEASLGLAGVGKVGGSVAGLYGLGVEGKAALGLTKDDKGRQRFKGELKLGAALGVGLTLGVKFDINVDGIMVFGANLMKANKAFFNKVGRTFNAGTRKVSQTAKKAVGEVKLLGKKVLGGVKKFGKDVGKTIEKIEQKIENVAEKVGEGVKTAAKKVGGFFKKLFR